MKRSLVALHEKCKELNVTELAMPRIGCGLDKLDWHKVKSMLEDIFYDGFAIKIYNLEKVSSNLPVFIELYVYCFLFLSHTLNALMINIFYLFICLSRYFPSASTKVLMASSMLILFYCYYRFSPDFRTS